MKRSILEKLPKSAREWSILLGTALMLLGAVRIYGLAGTTEMQAAAGLPGMSVSALLTHIALDACLILAGYGTRRAALRAAGTKKRAKFAALLGAILPR